MAHTAHLHQLAGLCFHTLGNIYHHNYAVHSCQCTIGVFCEILVPGCIENIDFIIAVLKPHHGSSYGNPALPFDLHPVGCGGFFYLV